MTKREFFNAIINNEINEDVITYATEALAKMDETNAKRTSSANDKKSELGAQILEVMEAGKEYTASELATVMNWFNEKNGKPNTSKASSVMRELVENGKVTAHYEEVNKKPSKVYTKI